MCIQENGTSKMAMFTPALWTSFQYLHEVETQLYRLLPGENVIRWNQLDQRAVGASSINAFKGCLNKTRETRMGFFMD